MKTHNCEATQACVDTVDSYECVCYDREKFCKEKASTFTPSGGTWCDGNKSYAKIKCRNSCKICKSPDACENTNKDCNKWAKAGECSKDPDLMNSLCAKSCNFC